MSKFETDSIENSDDDYEEGDIISSVYLAIRISLKELIKQLTEDNIEKIVDIISDGPNIETKNAKLYKKICDDLNEYFQEHFDDINNGVDKATFLKQTKDYLNNLENKNFYLLLSSHDNGYVMVTNIHLEQQVSTYTTFDILLEQKALYKKFQKELKLTNCQIVIAQTAAHSG